MTQLGYLRALVLLETLGNSQVGCHAEQEFMGVLGYADDILIEPAKRSMNAILDICTEFHTICQFFAVPPVSRRTR